MPAGPRGRTAARRDGLNRWRQAWELPGGIREAGERPRDAASRELAEETGLEVDDLTWVGLARFALVDPTRDELAAVYSVGVGAEVTPVPADDELIMLMWVDPNGSPPPPESSPIDLAIARWAVALDQ